MSIEFAGITFDRVGYDVLYLHHGDPSTAIDFDASPEGHAFRFDGQGALVGMTIPNARWLLDHDGGIRITVPTPEQIRLMPEQLQHTLAAA